MGNASKTQDNLIYSSHLFISSNLNKTLNPSVYLSVCLFVCRSCSFISPFIYLSVRSSVCSFVYPFICLSIHSSVRLFVYTFLRLSCPVRILYTQKAEYPLKFFSSRNLSKNFQNFSIPLECLQTLFWPDVHLD